MNPAYHEAHLLQHSTLQRVSFTPRDFNPPGPDSFHVARPSIPPHRNQSDLLALPALSKPRFVISSPLPLSVATAAEMYYYILSLTLCRLVQSQSFSRVNASPALSIIRDLKAGGSGGVRSWVVDVPAGQHQLPVHLAILSIRYSGLQIRRQSRA
jgi:hypothetical protein